MTFSDADVTRCWWRIPHNPHRRLLGGWCEGRSAERRPVEVVEHAQLMSGGGMHVRPDDPEIERIYPLAKWMPAQRRHGGRVFRRRVIVVEDWTEVLDGDES